MKKLDTINKASQKRGVALVLVISVLAILVVLTVSLLSISQSERISSDLQVHQEESRQLADLATNVVMGQIWAATTKDETSTRKIWASQPGAVRTYTMDGAFSKGFKLFSSSEMVVDAAGLLGERTMAFESPPSDWNTLPAKYVDLNDPVVRPGAGAGSSVHFPIIDPRAYVLSKDGQVNTPSTNEAALNKNVEGFWYNGGFTGAKAASDYADITARVPMPVEWIYVLKDGTMGTLDASLKFKSPGSEVPSVTNPIVGRIAFWTDDESCKVNINTASEPTSWSVPTFFHEREQRWAFNQPTAFEYQRYPGHPATVALSSVLFPNQDMDLYGKSVGDAKSILLRKESIYALAPKIAVGGSKAGTVPYWKFFDSRSPSGGVATPQAYIDMSAAMKERLYSSVDELLFERDMDGNDKRKLNSLVNEAGATTGAPLFSSPEELDKLRFFLTAQSRMPEVNMYGMPRVAIWPIFDEIVPSSQAGLGELDRDKDAKKYRTGFDELIAFCSSMGRRLAASQEATRTNSYPKSYFFRRADAYSSTYDISQISRNGDLLSYLEKLTSEKFPGGKSFSTKYGNDNRQILVGIFDYIRSTNLYDSFLAPSRAVLTGSRLANSNPATPPGYLADGISNWWSKRPRYYYTFTRDRAGNTSGTEVRSDNTFPGHGQVTPSRDMKTGSNVMGFGRFITLTEVGFHFICTADGETDKGSFVTPKRVKETNPTDPSETVDVFYYGDAAFAGPTPPVSAKTYDYSKPDSSRSGGRTALKLKPHPNTSGGSGVAESLAATFPGQVNPKNYLDQPSQVWYSNYPPRPNAALLNKWRVDTTLTDSEDDKKDPRHPRNHPGCNPANWNMSLPTSYELKPNQRCIQGMLALELSMLAPGFVPLNPDFSLVIEGLAGVLINGQPAFTTNVATYRAGTNLFTRWGCKPNAGSIDPFALSIGRRVRDMSTLSTKVTSPDGTLLETVGGVSLPSDTLYDNSAATSSNPHVGTNNFDLVTNFIIVDKSGFSITGTNIRVKLYSSHNISNADNLVQTFEIDLSDAVKKMPANIPTPELVTMSTDHEKWTDSSGRAYDQRCLDAPHWWAFNRDGVVNRYANGTWRGAGPGNVAPSLVSFVTVNPYDQIERTMGRLYARSDARSRKGVPRDQTIVWGYHPYGEYNSGLLKPVGAARDESDDVYADTAPTDTQAQTSSNRTSRGGDVIFTMIPASGDLRITGGKQVVPSTDWVPSPLCSELGKTDGTYYSRVMFAHSLSRAGTAGNNVGFDVGAGPAASASSSQLISNHLVKLDGIANATDYGGSYIPDVPTGPLAVLNAARIYGDFDNSSSTVRDGGYINKPDEGDSSILYYTLNGKDERVANAYLGGIVDWVSAEPGEAFMSPNRMVSSPGMFGSLPTGVNAGIPWRTLLFRPSPMANAAAVGSHPGMPSHVTGRGGQDPADHYYMDLFWMPIVEPYAISEPFSTAGKININYQIVPFPHIRRSTGLHAVLKGEMLSAVPRADATRYKSADTSNNKTWINNSDGYAQYSGWSEKDATNPRYWHRPIEAEVRAGNQVLGTIRQIEDRFKFATTAFTSEGAQGLFRTASQICEIYLIPKKVKGVNPSVDGSDSSASSPYVTAEMPAFWQSRALTGDNSKERPYANIYAKITTQSNTYRVHYRVQSIRKARSTNADTFSVTGDTVLSDYRGSSLIERRIDFSNPEIPDYAALANPMSSGVPTLNEFYKFRVLESKRFIP